MTDLAVSLENVFKSYGPRKALNGLDPGFPGLLLHVHCDEASIRQRLTGLPGVTGVQVFAQSLEEIFLSYVEGSAGA